MNSTITSTTRLARSLAVGVALAGLSVGTVGVGTAGAAQVDHPSSLRGGHDDPPGDDHGGHGGDDGAGDDHGGSGAGGGGDDDRVIRTGSCSGEARWKLKVKTDDGRLEVEGEIDSNVAGQRWRWALRHNGSVSDRGVATTTARSGSFEVERKVVDLAGTDALLFRAVRDGQVCRGVVNY